MPVIELQQASLTLGGRTLWQQLNLSVARGEFLVILGPNGSGKTSLLNVMLGLLPLTSGTVAVLGHSPQIGRDTIGYIPQQKGFDADLPIRGWDLVRLGLDGEHYGFSGHSQAIKTKVDAAIRQVGATDFASAPIGLLSGGEQQRLRVAQALLSDPEILLCDEPLLSLDLSQQQVVMALINERRKQSGMAVVFVTHDINPALEYVDRVLYVVGQKWAVGKPEDVLTSHRLSVLYDTPVDVLRVRGRIVVVGVGEAGIEGDVHHPGHHHHEHV